jgi:hypothetical protein
MESALLIIENPWDTPDQDPKRSSVFPFLQGLEKILNNFNIYYSTFYDNSGFKKALEYDLTRTKEKRQILYIASHGDKKQFAHGTPNILSSIPKYGKKIEGVMVGSCYIGSNFKIISSILEYNYDNKVYGANWVYSYRNYINWMATMIIDLAILEQIYIKNKNPLKSKEKIISAFFNALNCFNPNWKMAQDENGHDVDLKSTISLAIRPQGAKQVYDVTENLLDELEWH